MEGTKISSAEIDMAGAPTLCFCVSCRVIKKSRGCGRGQNIQYLTDDTEIQNNWKLSESKILNLVIL